MPTINRYTDIQPARYNPMSLQELMLVPQYKRTQHDNLLEAGSALNEGLLQADPLDIHSDAVRAEQERIGNSIQSQVDLLAKEGFNPNSKQAFFDLNKQYNQAISPTGLLGKANIAKKTLLANKKAHIDAAVKEGFSMDEALMNWQKHEQKYIDEYKATGEIQEIGSLGNPKYVDYLDEATKIFKDAGFTERDLAGGMISQIVTTDPRGQYILNTGGGKITRNNIDQLQDAVDWLNNNISNPNSEIGKSIAYQGKDPNQVLQEIGNLANVYIEDSQKNDYSRTITGYKSAKELGLLGMEGNVAHTTTEASNVKRFDNTLSNALDDVINGKLIQVATESNLNSVNPSNVGSFSAFGTTGNSAKFKSQAATIENSLTSSEKERYDNIYQTLLENDMSASAIIYDKYHPEVVKDVQEYLKKYNTNILRQDTIIQGDIVKTYGESTGVNSKSVSDIDRYNKMNRANLKYSYDGKEYDFNDLPENIRLQFDKAIYTGYMSPKNFIGADKQSNSDLYVSPHVYTIVDPDTGKTEELLVGRTSGERKSPEFQADRRFNLLYQKALSNPFKNIDASEFGVNIKYNPESRQHPYIITSKSTGQKEAMDETTLHNAIYQYILDPSTPVLE